MGVRSGLEMLISMLKGSGFDPLAMTLVLKFTTVGSTRNLGFTPTPLIALSNEGISPTPASFSGI
jgi:hypothetical protein